MNDDTTNTTDREDASDLQQWIDGLLRSSDAVELEAAPTTTHVAATTAIKQLHHYRKRRQALAVFASAAAIAAIAMWFISPLPRSERSGEGLAKSLVTHAHEAPVTVENPSPSPSAPQPLFDLQGRGIKVVARFESNGETIAIPLASDDPQVSIVKLYPTTTTERRWRRESTLYARHSGQDGG